MDKLWIERDGFLFQCYSCHEYLLPGEECIRFKLPGKYVYVFFHRIPDEKGEDCYVRWQKSHKRA